MAASLLHAAAAVPSQPSRTPFHPASASSKSRPRSAAVAALAPAAATAPPVVLLADISPRAGQPSPPLRAVADLRASCLTIADPHFLSTGRLEVFSEQMVDRFDNEPVDDGPVFDAGPIFDEYIGDEEPVDGVSEFPNGVPARPSITDDEGVPAPPHVVADHKEEPHDAADGARNKLLQPKETLLLGHAYCLITTQEVSKAQQHLLGSKQSKEKGAAKDNDYTRACRIDEAYVLFQQMPETMLSNMWAREVSSWHILQAALVSSGCLLHAHNLFAKMAEQGGIQPKPPWTFVEQLRGGGVLFHQHPCQVDESVGTQAVLTGLELNADVMQPASSNKKCVQLQMLDNGNIGACSYSQSQFIRFAPKIQELLGVHRSRYNKLAMPRSTEAQRFLLPVSECEFNITSAIEDLSSMYACPHGHCPLRATGAAISTAIALLEGCCSPSTGGRIMVFTSGPATVGPGLVVETDLGKAIRSHRDIFNSSAMLADKARDFYKKVAKRLTDHALVLDLFACSLDQVGAAELRNPIEVSGGLMVHTESFESEQFKSCFRHMFKRAGSDYLNMNFNATIEIVTSKEVKICGALGPCISLRRKNSSVSDKEIGEGGTNYWKTSSLSSKTCIAFFFRVDCSHKAEPPTVFFIQFMTMYRHGDGSYRLRVTTVARRWAAPRSTKVSVPFQVERVVARPPPWTFFNMNSGRCWNMELLWHWKPPWSYLHRNNIICIAASATVLMEAPQGMTMSTSFSCAALLMSVGLISGVIHMKIKCRSRGVVVIFRCFMSVFTNVEYPDGLLAKYSAHLHFSSNVKEVPDSYGAELEFLVVPMQASGSSNLQLGYLRNMYKQGGDEEENELLSELDLQGFDKISRVDHEYMDVMLSVNQGNQGAGHVHWFPWDPGIYSSTSVYGA